MADALTTAVNGWNQAAGLLACADTALTFLIEEMKAESKRNPSAFETNEVKARLFADAEATSRLIAAYVSAQRSAQNRD